MESTDINMKWFGGFTVPVAITVARLIIVATQTSVFDIPCSFEEDLCSWTSVNIKRTEYANSLATPGRSGPKQAQNGVFYVYLDTSTKSRGAIFNGSLQRDGLEVPVGSDKVCLRFWYHMFGETMGSLEVLIDDTAVWNKIGNQNDKWHCAVVDIGALRSEISFVADMGDDIYSIIAIDSIDVLNTECKQQDCENLQFSTTIKTTAPGSSTLPSTSPTESVDITTTAATQINLQEYLPLIVGIPAAILVIGTIVLFVCLKRQKTKHAEPIMVVPTNAEQNGYGEFPQDPYNSIKEEVYSDIEEWRMVPDESLNALSKRVTKTDHTGQENNNDPIPQNGELVSNQGRKDDDDDYLTPTSRQSDAISPRDDDYITPTTNPGNPQSTSSSVDSGEPVRTSLHRPSITSAGAEVDYNDYLVLTGTKGKKGTANLAFSLKE